MKQVDLYTDGACSVNPGVGGWGVVLLYKNHRKEKNGACAGTTNNRMELTAIIEGLRLLNERCAVTVFSDSAYSLNPFLKDWITVWQLNGWRSSGKNDVKNVDLWKALLAEIEKHEVRFVKVKGHSDNELNNRCDFLARAAIKEFQKSKIPKAD